jgi:hypothetical protein
MRSRLTSGAPIPPPAYSSETSMLYKVASVRESRDTYLRHYRNTVTIPKMTMAEQLLANCSRNHVRSATAAAVSQLRRASNNYLCVVPHVHDLWSEQMFRRSTADGAGRSQFPESRFLKPLSDFTDIELRFEETLAAMDLRALAQIADKMRIADETGGAADIERPGRPGEHEDTPLMIDALASLAGNERFLRLAMKPIHRNWARASRLHQLMPPAEERDFTASDFDHEGLRANVRADLLAVLLFSAGL